MRKILYIGLFVLAAVGASALTFTDVNSASYWGKTDIPKLTSVLDANFALAETGFQVTNAAIVKLAKNDGSSLTNVTGTASASGTVLNALDISACTNLAAAGIASGNIAAARITNALTTSGASIGGNIPAAAVTNAMQDATAGAITLPTNTSVSAFIATGEITTNYMGTNTLVKQAVGGHFVILSIE